MVKKKYIVKEAYLAFRETNIYRGGEVELNPSNPGTKKLLDIGAIELKPAPKKEAVSGSDN